MKVFRIWDGYFVAYKPCNKNHRWGYHIKVAKNEIKCDLVPPSQTEIPGDNWRNSFAIFIVIILIVQKFLYKKIVRTLIKKLVRQSDRMKFPSDNSCQMLIFVQKLLKLFLELLLIVVEIDRMKLQTFLCFDNCEANHKMFEVSVKYLFFRFNWNSTSIVIFIGLLETERNIQKYKIEDFGRLFQNNK